jgi:hypothetical protein
MCGSGKKGTETRGRRRVKEENYDCRAGVGEKREGQKREGDIKTWL